MRGIPSSTSYTSAAMCAGERTVGLGEGARANRAAKNFEQCESHRRASVMKRLVGGLLAHGVLPESERSTTVNAIYLQTNDAEQNEVIAFRRDADGTLTRLGSWATGGRGTGKPHLASQSSVVVERRRLLVVNAGSDDSRCSRSATTGSRLSIASRRAGRCRRASPSAARSCSCSMPAATRTSPASRSRTASSRLRPTRARSPAQTRRRSASLPTAHARRHRPRDERAHLAAASRPEATRRDPVLGRDALRLRLHARRHARRHRGVRRSRRRGSRILVRSPRSSP